MCLGQLVEQPVERQCLSVHGTAAAPGDAAADVDEVAVVVPLEEGDVVVVEQGHQGVPDVGVGVRVLEVEHLLVSPRRRQLAPAPEQPVRMGAGQVGVLVDHLGLDPQTELHAERADVVDERVQPVGPAVPIDGPVSQGLRVVGATLEPAVVEHEPLDTDLGCRVREPGEGGQVVVEVDRLPGVEHDGPRLAAQVGHRPDVRVQPCAQAVEPFVGPAGEHPRRGVGLTGGEHHLTRGEQLTAAQPGVPLGGPLGQALVVAAPRDVQPPHLPGAEGEARGACDEEQGSVVAGAAVPAAAQPGALLERQPLRRPLTRPAAGEVQQLTPAARHGQRGQHAADRVAAPSRVGQRVVEGQHSRRRRDR